MGYGQVHLGEVDVHAKFGQLRLSSLGIRGWFVFCAEVLGGFIYTRLYLIKKKKFNKSSILGVVKALKSAKVSHMGHKTRNKG